MPAISFVANLGKDEPTKTTAVPQMLCRYEVPITHHHRTKAPFRDTAIRQKLTAVTTFSFLTENGIRVMSRTPPLRFGKLRSKFPEDPTEHHAAMRLGSLELAPRPSATKAPPGAPSRACLQRGFGLEETWESPWRMLHGSMKLAWALQRCSSVIHCGAPRESELCYAFLQKLQVSDGKLPAGRIAHRSR